MTDNQTTVLGAVEFNLSLKRSVYLSEALNVITSIGMIGDDITIVPIKLTVRMKPCYRGMNFSVVQVNGNLLFDADVGTETIVNRWSRGAWEGMLEAYSKERSNVKGNEEGTRELRRKPRVRATKKTTEGEVGGRNST